MVVNVEILFDNNQKLIFYSGQMLAGKVEVTVDKPVKVQRLILKIEGFAYCRWTESDSSTDSKGNSQSNDTSYTGNEKYIESTNYLISSLAMKQGKIQQSNLFLVISPGKHTYSFMIMLPADVPTSVEEKTGHIRYTASVVLERPWKFNLSHKIGLTVIRPLDLNIELPSSRLPSSMEVMKTFCCLFCASKPMIMTATLPMTAFVAGQTIVISIDIVNPTDTEVLYVEIKFMKICTFQSDSPSTKTRKDYQVLHKEECGASLGLIEKLFKIPVTPPSTFHKCRVVDVSYEIHIKAKVGGCHKSPELKIPIVIGTVPYRDLCKTPEALNSNQFTPTAPSLSDFNDFGGESSLYQIPPPSYEELMRPGAGGVEINAGYNPSSIIGQSSYNPSYPYYNLQQPVGFHLNLPDTFSQSQKH